MNPVRLMVVCSLLAVAGCAKGGDPANIFYANSEYLGNLVRICQDNKAIAIVRGDESAKKGQSPSNVNDIQNFLARNSLKSFQCDRDLANEGKLISVRIVTHSAGISVSGEIEGLVYFTEYGNKLNKNNIDVDAKSKSLARIPGSDWFVFKY